MRVSPVEIKQQSINWLVRKIMGTAVPTMEVNEYVGEDGKPHLDAVMTATAGIKGKDERILDWEPITKTNGPFGLVESESLSNQIIAKHGKCYRGDTC
jgi:hypothetical protein